MTGNPLPPHTIEGRLEALAAEVAELKGLAKQILGRTDGGLTELAARMDAQADDQRKEWYSVSEFALAVERKPYTVQEWCRMGRILARKREYGRSKSSEWEISREEIERYRNHGLRPLRISAQ